MKLMCFTGFIAVVIGLSPVAFAQAQLNDSPSQLRIVAPAFAQTKQPGAIVAAVQGAGEFSRDGRHFHSIKQGQFLPAGSVIRTKEAGQIDLYLKRTGVAIRLKKQTEIRLAKIEKSSGAGPSPMIAEVDLTKGSIVTLRRGSVPASFEISSASGLTAASCQAEGQYLISASGSEMKSFNVAQPNHLSLAARSSVAEQENDFGRNPRDLVSQLLEFDEIQSLAEVWTTDLGPAGASKN